MTTRKNTATKIADACEDGQRFNFLASFLVSRGLDVTGDDDDEITLCEVCYQHEGRRSVFGDSSVYEFDDGSAIVCCGTGWDVRAAGCERACMEGSGCWCSD